MEFYFSFSYLWSFGSKAESVGIRNRHGCCMWAQGKAHLEPTGCERRNSHEEHAHCRITTMQKFLSSVWCLKILVRIYVVTHLWFI